VSIKEFEPNDTKEDAQLVNLPLRLKGSIKENDMDWFKFVVGPEECFNISFELITKDFNPLRLSIYFQDQIIKSLYIKKGIEQDQNNIFIKNLFVLPGVYYIKIDNAYKISKSISYSFNVIKYSYNSEEETEPNDNFNRADEIDLKRGYIKGYYSPEWNMQNDEEIECDWFKFFVAEKSNQISIEITSVPNVNPVIELYDELGFLLRKIDGFGIDEPEVLKNFFVNNPGWYYIKVYPKNLGEVNNKIPYNLYLKIEKGSPEFEIEPNDNINYANLLVSHIKGYITPKNDVDWFYFDIEKKSFLNFAITPLLNIDFVVEIYSSTEEKIFTIDSFSAGEAEVFPNLYLAEGRYFLKIYAKNFEQNIDNYYDLKIEAKPFSLDWEIEPNNDFNLANVLNLNKSIKGFICPAGDLDYYKIVISDKRRIKFFVTSVSSVDFVIEIFNSKKENIATINKNKSGAGENEIIELLPDTYYVILKDAENKRSNYYENYIFAILER
jgi:hypothetical protein